MENFSFVNHYRKHEIVYVFDVTYDNKIKKTKIRTIYPSYMVGNIDKGEALFIGIDKKDLIFTSLKEAQEYVRNHNITITNKEQNEEYSLDSEEEEEDNINLYIDEGDDINE